MPSTFDWSYKKTKKRPNRVYIYNDTYQEGVLVVWPVNAEQLAAEYKHFNKRELKNPFIGSGKYIRYTGDCGMMAFSKDKPSLNCVGHECVHFVKDVLWTRNLTKSRHDEAEAYMMGWAVETIYNKIRGIK